MPSKNIPIGVDNFAKLLAKENNYLFTDKTLLIKEVIDDKSEVTLITRPRRWGKTLNLSMLQHFFAAQVHGRITQGLFSDLKIAQANEGSYLQHQGKYPVIFISFKDVKETTFDEALAKIKSLIKELYREHEFLLQSDKLSEASKKIFIDYLSGEPDRAKLEEAIKLLCEFLYKHYDKEAYIFIDEYDAPLNAAYANYLDEMTHFMKNLFSAALKGNSFLKKGIMTGILRISKDSMLSGLSNVDTHTLLDDGIYQHYFGFTEQEVNALLTLYKLENHSEEIKSWYNGYQVGDSILYNPWSIMFCIKKQGELRPYWVNTSDDSLLRESLLNATDDAKAGFRQLIAGQSIQGQVSDFIHFEEVKTDDRALWSLLLAAGYLKAMHKQVVRTHYQCTLAIPNEEVKTLYVDVFSQWLQKTLGTSNYQSFMDDLIKGNTASFAKKLGDYLARHTSSYDFSRESNYHTFVLGLLCSVTDTHYLYSNIEAGIGRLDVMLIPKPHQNKQAVTDLGIILEFKHAKLGQNQTKLAKDALAQIDMKTYQAALEQYRHVQRILKIGIAFLDKSVVTYDRIDSLNNEPLSPTKIREARFEGSLEFDEEKNQSSPLSVSSTNQTHSTPATSSIRQGQKRERSSISRSGSLIVEKEHDKETETLHTNKLSRLTADTANSSSSSCHGLFNQSPQLFNADTDPKTRQKESPNLNNRS